jgi:antitoxin (DNA-binding transcriptional repressor) of toxin-antitoxin stability system
VAEGEEIILARDGTPCARIVPLEAHSPRVPGILNAGRKPRELGQAFFDPLPEGELALWSGQEPSNSATRRKRPKGRKVGTRRTVKKRTTA